MINIIRKNQQALMIAITVLVSISMVLFYNMNRGTNHSGGTDRIATIYNRGVSQSEFEREARKFPIAYQLGLKDLVQVLSGSDQNRAIEIFIWNLMVLRHEAARLQINPTDDEVKTATGELPAFKTGDSFDPAKLNAFIANVLAPRGFTDTVIEDMVRDSLRLQKLRALIGSSVDVTSAELRGIYDQAYQKTQVSVIRLKQSDLLAGIQISDEDAKKTFEQRKETYKSDEQRKVEYVKLALTDAESALNGKERVDALQKLANKANDFTQAMLEKGANFQTVATRFGAPVETTGLFTLAAPDTKLEKLPKIVSAAFQVTQDDPNSDVIQAENAFYVLHLDQIVPSRPLSFEEAKSKIVEQLKTERVHEELTQKGSEIRTKVDAGLKAGKSFAEAAASEKPEQIPPFSLSELNQESVPELQQIASKSLEMGAGQLSEFLPTAYGGILIYLEKRQPVDETGFEKKKADMATSYITNKQTIAFLEWLRLSRDAAKIQITATR